MDDILAVLKERAGRAIGEKVFPGCVVGLIRQDNTTTPVQVLSTSLIVCAGTLEGKVPTNKNTIYDLASITKSIPLATLALALIDEGKLALADEVKTYLPELRNDHGTTIEDLLRYRVTGPQLSSLQFKTFEEIRTHILERGFDGPPGESVYTNLPAFVLGLILERVTGENLPALAHRYFFEPFKMIDTTFSPTVPDTSISTGRHKLMRPDQRIAPTEIVGGVEIKGIVHDESARCFSRAYRAVGHAGLFSTAPDLLKFLEALLNGKLPAVVEGAQKGLGWEVDREWMGSKRRKKTFGKTGFTGTSILCDVERGVGLVILSNRTYPHRPPDNSAINLFRKDIADIVFG